jgi:hypothetical protein
MPSERALLQRGQLQARLAVFRALLDRVLQLDQGRFQVAFLLVLFGVGEQGFGRLRAAAGGQAADQESAGNDGGDEFELGVVALHGVLR